MSWEMGPGVVEFPDGVRVRGRGLTREACPDPRPEWGLYLLASPAQQPCPGRWVRWRDFWLPGDGNDARLAFTEAYHRAAAGARVEIACGGGKGRTGTALACIAALGRCGRPTAAQSDPERTRSRSDELLAAAPVSIVAIPPTRDWLTPPARRLRQRPLVVPHLSRAGPARDGPNGRRRTSGGRSPLRLGRPEPGSRGDPRRGDRLAPIRATSAARIWWPVLSGWGSARRRDRRGHRGSFEPGRVTSGSRPAWLLAQERHSSCDATK